MSETVLKILLAELLTLRIVCKQCGSAVEVVVATLDRQQQPPRWSGDVRCPGCGFVIRQGVAQGHPPQTDAFDNLSAGLRALGAMPNVDCEFIVLAPPKT